MGMRRVAGHGVQWSAHVTANNHGTQPLSNVHTRGKEIRTQIVRLSSRRRLPSLRRVA